VYISALVHNCGPKAVFTWLFRQDFSHYLFLTCLAGGLQKYIEVRREPYKINLDRRFVALRDLLAEILLHASIQLGKK
jgi:hypothetical protein